MGVYHITCTPELKEVCLYHDGGCSFSCHGCITDWHPKDCHLDEETGQIKNRTLDIEEVLSYLKPLAFKKVIFLGKEPTVDSDFLPLAKILKKHFFTCNILLTNAWEYVEDEALDEVCVSIKAVTPSVFKDFTGKDDPKRVLKNFKRYVNPVRCRKLSNGVNKTNLKIRAESVFIPNYIDEREIEKIACFISEVDKTILYRIDAYIPFNNDKFRRPTEDEMNKAKIIAEKYLENVYILHKGVKVRYPVKRIY